jgi:hypothetical protein
MKLISTSFRFYNSILRALINISYLKSITTTFVDEFLDDIFPTRSHLKGLAIHDTEINNQKQGCFFVVYL